MTDAELTAEPSDGRRDVFFVAIYSEYHGPDAFVYGTLERAVADNVDIRGVLQAGIYKVWDDFDNVQHLRRVYQPGVTP